MPGRSGKCFAKAGKFTLEMIKRSDKAKALVAGSKLGDRAMPQRNELLATSCVKRPMRAEGVPLPAYVTAIFPMIGKVVA